MIYEEKRIRKIRMIWAAILLANIISIIIFASNDTIIPFIVIPIFLLIFTLSIFISTFMINCRKYKINGHDIIIYAGAVWHYIKVDGEKTDEHNTLVSYTPISLSYTMEDGIELSVLISLTNHITFKMNGKLINY